MFGKNRILKWVYCEAVEIAPMTFPQLPPKSPLFSHGPDKNYKFSQVLSRDSVTVTVDAVVYYRVSNPTMATNNVEDFRYLGS